MKTAKTIKRSAISKSNARHILSRCDYINGCLVWPGATTRKNRGYGRIAIDGNIYCCHRAIWTFFNGEIRKGKIICHTCDNSLCCNIDHMFMGTQKENMIDMSKKGRRVNNPAKGVDNTSASLTLKEVNFIRTHAVKKDKKYSYTKLADKFGVSINTVARVAKGVRYI